MAFQEESRMTPSIFNFTKKTRKTLKSGCLSLLTISLLTIRSFGARNGLGLTNRVWLGFGLGGRFTRLQDYKIKIIFIMQGLSILYQMPFSLLKLAMWLRGYSRLKKVGLSRLFWVIAGTGRIRKYWSLIG
eukprot:sb/3475026/